MAALGGLLVVIGSAIGGIEVASVFLGGALVHQLHRILVQRQDRLKASAGAKPVSEEEAPLPLPDRP